MRRARHGERRHLEPAPPAVSLTGRIHYEQWACSPVGVPHLKDGHVRLEGKDEPTRIAATTAKVCIDLTPRIEGNRLILAARTRCLEPEGEAGQVVDRLHLEKTLEQLADKALNQALGHEDLTAMLPAELRPYHPTFTDARFTQLADGTLGLHLEGTLSAGAADLAALPAAPWRLSGAAFADAPSGRPTAGCSPGLEAGGERVVDALACFAASAVLLRRLTLVATPLALLGTAGHGADLAPASMAWSVSYSLSRCS